MMRVEWTGLDAFLKDLHALPQDLQRDGFVIVREETEGAAAEIVQRYAPARKTGALERRVQTQFPSSTILVGLVLSLAPHSHLYEWGTKKRKNAAGSNRGTMPAAKPKITGPIARRRRARMSRRLVDLLRANGFEVGYA
jgi:hypothetical protein